MLKIPPDYTFVVQIALFVALWIVLKRFWFDPALRIVRERAARSEGAIA
jgi:F0F1-type ATP synthase membrane subunit b/b'